MKIILSNFELTEAARKKLDAVAKSKRYELRKDGDIDSSEKSLVDVLLYLPKEGWLTKERVNDLPNLKLIQSFTAGVEHIDFALFPQDVIICGNVNAFSEQIAEHVFGMVLVHAKRLFLQNSSLKNGYFDHRADAMFLKGKKMGILGAGGIGQAVARLAKCFGMNTLGVNRSGNTVEFFDEVTPMQRIDDALSQSDIVIISLPLTVKTRGLIDRSKLELMKENCILVNVARAAIVVEGDLFNHLRTHPKFRAGFDVWWIRPKDHAFAQHFPFFELENFIGTPHVSGDVPESYELTCESLVANVIRYVEGQPLKGISNRDDYLGLHT